MLGQLDEMDRLRLKVADLEEVLARQAREHLVRELTAKYDLSDRDTIDIRTGAIMRPEKRDG